MSWKLIKQISGNSHSNGGVDMTLNNQPVEVEGGELLFKNTDTGAMAVTPKRDSQMLLPHVYSNSPFLDQYIGNLKHVGKYAKDGIEVPLSGTVSRIKEDNDMRRDLIFRFPGIESAYGYFASDLGLIHDPDFKAHNIEFMASGNPGNTYDLEDGKYIYGNPNPERDNVIYNDNARKGDIMLDVISHSPLLKQTKEYQNVSNAIMDENRDDIDYFYEMDVASGRFGDGRARWVENYVDGKIRAYMSQTYKDLDLDDATRADYELEIVSPKSKAAIQKYHDNVLTKVDPIYHNNRLIEAQKYQDGLEHRESVIRGLERSIKAEYGLVVGDPLKQKKDVPNRQINPDVLYGYTPEEEKFLKKHYQYAKKIGEAQGIDPLILLTQVATETSFNDGNYANNNIFGIKSNKDKSGQPIGNYKFERTQEWMDDDKQDHRFLKPVLNKTYYEDRKQWLYDVEEPFVKFDSLEEGYEGVVDFWGKNSRYKSALEKKDNAEEFFNELGKSGYSSSSKYGETLQKNYKKVSAYVKYKMEDGGVIPEEPKKPWWMPDSMKEPQMVNDNIKRPTGPTWLQQGIADSNIMSDVDFEKKYHVHKHGWALMNSPEYAAEVEANIDSNNANTIDYPKTSYLSRNYQGNPNLEYTRTNQSGTDMIKAMEMAHMEAVGAALPIPGLDNMGAIPSIFKMAKYIVKDAEVAKNAINIFDNNLNNFKYAEEQLLKANTSNKVVANGISDIDFLNPKKLWRGTTEYYPDWNYKDYYKYRKMSKFPVSDESIRSDFDNITKHFAKERSKIGSFLYGKEKHIIVNEVNDRLYGGHNYTLKEALAYMFPSLGSIAAIGAGIKELDIQLPLYLRKKLNLISNEELAELNLSKSSMELDLSNEEIDYIQTGDFKEGRIIIGGEFIESSNNSVRTANEWKKDQQGVYSDHDYPINKTRYYYGVENNKFKIDSLQNFNPNTIIVPVRGNNQIISKSELTDENEMRLFDNKNEPIYHATQNSGKFILYSPSTKKSKYFYINNGLEGVNKVNKFVKENKDAIYVMLDNGRFEYMLDNEDGLTEEDYETYFGQDYEREKGSGYNLIIK